MTGRILPPPPEAHVCTGRPPAEHYRAATRWECDECGKLWVVVEGAQYNESYSAWRELTAKNKSGSDVF